MTPADILDRQETQALIRKIAKFATQPNPPRALKDLCDYSITNGARAVMILQLKNTELWLLCLDPLGVQECHFCDVDGRKKTARYTLPRGFEASTIEKIVAYIKDVADIKIEPLNAIPEAAELCAEFLKKWAALSDAIETDETEKVVQKRSREEQAENEKRQKLSARLSSKLASIKAEKL